MEIQKPFKTGIIAVWGFEDAHGGIFENSEIQTIGNQQFITGNLIDDGSGDYQIGKRFWFPVNNVVMVMEYDNLEQAVASRINSKSDNYY